MRDLKEIKAIASFRLSKTTGFLLNASLTVSLTFHTPRGIEDSDLIVLSIKTLACLFIFTKYSKSFSVHIKNLEQLTVEQIQEIESFVKVRNGIFDFNTYTVVMTVDTKNYDLGAMAHEFKHAYQFEVGELDLTSINNNEGGILASRYTESEANYRSQFFGTTTTTPPINYDGRKSTKGYTEAIMSSTYKRLKALHKHAYRINKQTKIWKP